MAHGSYISTSSEEILQLNKKHKNAALENIHDLSKMLKSPYDFFLLSIPEVIAQNTPLQFLGPSF